MQKLKFLGIANLSFRQLETEINKAWDVFLEKAYPGKEAQEDFLEFHGAITTAIIDAEMSIFKSLILENFKKKMVKLFDKLPDKFGEQKSAQKAEEKRKLN